MELRADNSSEYEKRQLFNWTEEVEEVEMIIYPKELKRIEDSNKIKLVDFFRVSTKYISFALFIVKFFIFKYSQKLKAVSNSEARLRELLEEKMAYISPGHDELTPLLMANNLG